MENSKSDEQKESTVPNTKTLVDKQTAKIVKTNVEIEIQSALLTSNLDPDQPSCSWKVDKLEVIPAPDDQPSSPSTSTDKNTLQGNVAVQETVDSNKPISQSHLDDADSLTTLFDDIEVLGSVTATLPQPSVANQHPQSPRGTNQTRIQSVITKQPRAQPNVHSRNQQLTGNSSQGVHVVNFPNDSINRSLQRGGTAVAMPNSTTTRIQITDQVLGPPPSYSKSLLDRRVNTCASIQFVAPIPPPSYDGVENELRYAHTLGHTAGFTLGLGNTWQGQPQPAYCPVCETVIITQIDVRVSRVAHILAMVMFLILCWPFCLLPYFFNICNYTFHYCSVCHSYLGARRPFQRG